MAGFLVVTFVEEITKVLVQMDPDPMSQINFNLLEVKTIPAGLPTMNSIYMARNRKTDLQLYLCDVKEVNEEALQENVILIDFGLRKRVKLLSLFMLPPPLANWPPAATPVTLVDPPGVPDSLEMKKAQEKKFQGTSTSLLLAREGDTPFGRFFVSDQEVDLGRRYQEEVLAVGGASPPPAVSSPNSSVEVKDIEEEVETAWTLDLAVGVLCPVVLTCLEDMDKIWVTGR